MRTAIVCEFHKAEATLVCKHGYLQRLAQNTAHSRYSTDRREMNEMISILSAYFMSGTEKNGPYHLNLTIIL